MVSRLSVAVVVLVITATQLVVGEVGNVADGVHRPQTSLCLTPRLAFQARIASPACQRTTRPTTATRRTTTTQAGMYKRRASREEEKMNWEKRNRGAPDVTNIDKTLPGGPAGKKKMKKKKMDEDLKLAMESAIKISANVVSAEKNTKFDEVPPEMLAEYVFMVQGKKMTLDITDFVHYKTVQEVPADLVESQLQILATSLGVEEYRSMEYQGDRAVHDATLAPYDAILKACSSDENFLGRAMKAKTIVVNILGGDDLSFSQVSTALISLIQLMSQVVGDAPPLPKFCLNSVSFQDFPQERAALTLVALPNDVATGDGVDAAQSVAEGEVYFHSGKWWTVAKQDINHVSWHDKLFGDGEVVAP